MKLASGAELEIQPAPFADAKALFQAFLEEARGVEIKGGVEMGDVLKNIFCSAFASAKLEAALYKCLERSRYNKLKIVPDLFEDVKAREDYLEVCYLVAEENLRPFTKSLYARFKDLLKRIESIHA